MKIGQLFTIILVFLLPVNNIVLKKEQTNEIKEN